MYIPNTLRVPDSLQLTVTRVRSGEEGGQTERYRASTGDANVEAIDEHPWVATLLVLCAVSDAQPLVQDCVDEILDAGFGPEVVDAWERHLRGRRLSDVRHVGEAAVNHLVDYLSVQVPPDQACEYLSLGLQHNYAARAHNAGMTSSDIAPYAKRLAKFSDKEYDYDYDASSPYAWNGHQVVTWALSEFDPDQAQYFMEADLSPDSVAAWVEIVAQQKISADDLRDIVCAGFTPERVRSSSDAYAATEVSVVEAARTLLALRRPGVATRHFVNQPNPWGQPGYQGGGYSVPAQVGPTGDPWATPAGP